VLECLLKTREESVALAILVRGLTKSVETSHEMNLILLWNQQVQTDRTAPNNKPDIIIPDNEKGKCLQIETAFSGYRNMIKKEAEKLLKYEDLTV
jgi:hypothetical protein